MVPGRAPLSPGERGAAARSTPEKPCAHRPALSAIAARCLRLALLAAVAIGLYLAARWLDGVVVAGLAPDSAPMNDRLLQVTVVVAIVVYIALMAVPFMPSAEIGLCLLMMFGARIAVVVYASTVLALTLSYLAGRLLPASVLARGFRLLGLPRLAVFVQRSAARSPSQAVALFAREAPAAAIPLLLRHRFLALALVFNLPGNTVIGGGGGIAFAAGMSRLFPLPLYLLTVALAVAPVPLIVFLAEQA